MSYGSEVRESDANSKVSILRYDRMGDQCGISFHHGVGDGLQGDAASDRVYKIKMMSKPLIVKLEQQGGKASIGRR